MVLLEFLMLRQWNLLENLENIRLVDFRGIWKNKVKLTFNEY